jgi:hypothetical protein
VPLRGVVLVYSRFAAFMGFIAASRRLWAAPCLLPLRGVYGLRPVYSRCAAFIRVLDILVLTNPAIYRRG